MLPSMPIALPKIPPTPGGDCLVFLVSVVELDVGLTTGCTDSVELEAI